MCLIYVDDILIIENDHKLIKDLKDVLRKNFKIEDLGDLKVFLGMEIARSKKGIIISQRKYNLELLAKTRATKPFKTPMEENIKFTSKEYVIILNKIQHTLNLRIIQVLRN